MSRSGKMTTHLSRSGALAQAAATNRLRSTAQRDFELWIVGQVNQKQRRIDDLDFDADLVHVLKTRDRVRQLAHSEVDVSPAGFFLLSRRRD